jgi:HSP20 family molecular chaperone IbpA
MTKKLLISMLLAASATSPLLAFGFHPDIQDEISYNEKQIKEYEKAISSLKKKNEYLKKERAKHPELYVKKPLFEETKKAYIQRIKLNGAKTDALNFTIKNNRIFISMNIKSENKEKDAYFYSSRSFAQTFFIPDNVQQDKIKHEIDGDYFTITMPKK